MTGTQDVSGNALEYAVAMQTACAAGVPLRDDAISQRAREDFMRQPAAERRQLTNAAIKSVLHFFEIESPLKLKETGEVQMQPDSAGRKGDPRDLILTLKKGGLGVSVKRNNDVMKNPRLQRSDPDFCVKWGLGGTHSSEYRQSVEKTFMAVDAEKQNGVRKWNEIDDMHEKVYAPVVNAFMREFKSLAVSPVVCKNFVRYAVGVPDYYKVMVYLKNRMVVVQGFNFGKSLACGKISYPQSLLSVALVNNTTLMLSFDGGWAFSMRIHNAITALEDSLKWDIRMKGHPANLYSHHILL